MVHDLDAGVGDHFFEYPPPHVGLKAADVRGTVGGRDGVVELRSDAAEGGALTEEIGGAEAAGAHAAGEARGVDDDDRATLTFCRDRRSDGGGGVSVDDEVVDDGCVGRRGGQGADEHGRQQGGKTEASDAV